MSSVNNNLLIQKDTQNHPFNIFRSKANQSENESEQAAVFENCLTEISTKLTVSDINVNQSESDSKDHGKSIHSQNVAEDLDNATTDHVHFLEQDGLCDEVDESDYFDSENEYWESLSNKQIGVKHCEICGFYIPTRDNMKNIHSLSCFIEVNSPLITLEAATFAMDNQFEIRDVYDDENCLFRSVADQFMINGCYGHTEISLRDAVIKHFGEDPSKYGIDKSLFIAGETLEDDLKKIISSGKWKDHTILKAIADVFQLELNVFNVYDDFTRMVFCAEANRSMPSRLSIFLAHVEQSHYFSLRPLRWMKELPYKAQIFRMLATCTDKSFEERKSFLEGKLAQISMGCVRKSAVTNSADFVLQCMTYEEICKKGGQTHSSSIFKSYTGESLQLEGTEDSKRAMTEDQSHIDHVSGIPIYYLTFIMKHTFPLGMIQKSFFLPGPLLKYSETYFHYLGYFSDNTEVTLHDVSLAQKMNQWNTRYKRSKSKKIAIIKNNFEVIPIDETSNVKEGPNCILVDCSETQPGYCRLRLPSNSSIVENELIYQLGSNMYLKPFKIPDEIYSQLESLKVDEIQCIGVICSFPFYSRLAQCRRRCDFPTRSVFDSIIKTGCTIIPKSHPRSTLPDIEWKFNFSMAECLIFKSLTVTQKHGYYILKLLLDNMIRPLPFKSKYLKSVYLTTCGEIPPNAWETNFGGCVLYALDSLLSCLKARYLPSYFMPERNLIDNYPENDIRSVITIVEFIRLFPTCSIQIVAEKHGFTHVPNMIKRVLGGVGKFTSTKNLHKIFSELFLPLIKATAKILAKMGFYATSYDMLEEAFEQSLLIPRKGMNQTSVSFFDLFVKAVMTMKQKSSRLTLSEMFDTRTGFNLLDTFKPPFLSLQDCLEWAVDPIFFWLDVPSEIVGDLMAISSFLYEISQREYLKRNKFLAELTITTAVRCIQETLKQEPPNVNTSGSSCLKREKDVKMIKQKLFQYYMHMYFVSTLDFVITPLNNYMDDIENLCKDLPEMAGFVGVMFEYVNQPLKVLQYKNMFDDYILGKGTL